MARPTSPVEFGGKEPAEHRELAVRWTAPWRSNDRATTPLLGSTIERKPHEDPRESSPVRADAESLGVITEPMS